MENYSQYNTATTSLTECLICALDAVKKYNYKAVIWYRENKDHPTPVKVINGALDNPFNWKCTSQFHRTPEEIKQAIEMAMNDTERDLLQNWTWIFGDPEAIKIYQTEGRITPGLLNGIGRCSQVRIKDLVNYLNLTGETERAKLWQGEQFFNSGLWIPNGISHYETADGMSYAVYFKENKDNTPQAELLKILDNSVKEII